MLIEEVSEIYGLKHVGNTAVLYKVPPTSGAQNGHRLWPLVKLTGVNFFL